MLRSSNPILSKKDAFTPAAPAGGSTHYQGYPGAHDQTAYAPYGQAPHGVQPVEGRMTLDDVITKTAVVMGLLVITAALSWMMVPATLYMPALILSALVGFGVVLLVSFRRRVSPPLVFVYAVIEGVFIGMISKIFEQMYSGIVAQAVLGTFVAAGVTLAAYKFFNIKVTPKFTKVVVIATIAFAGVMLVNFILSLFGVNAGLRAYAGGPVSLLAIAFALLGAGLAVLNLVLDFDYVERGVAMGAPAGESWRAAFGLTVTMVWLYVEILRLLSYIRR